MADTESQDSDFGTKAPCIENMRHFKRKDDGTVTAVDITTLKEKEFTFSRYAGNIDDDEEALPPARMYMQNADGTLAVVDTAKIDPEYVKKVLHWGAIERYKVMFARAQDACRELIIGIPACLSIHADLRKLCEGFPEIAKEMVNARECWKELVAEDAELSTIAAGDGPLEAKLLEKLAEPLKENFSRLPTQATIIANEFCRLRTNPPEHIELPTRSLKDLARKIINENETNESVLASMQEVALHFRERAEGSV
ncbi:hypothetical protein H2200_005709 [Cladophialophora chaetospira]|uniref:Uncharacterized protein n=1 Tax=Cladophialophora chaetospira TaxID=386627 RepID=A0AA38X9J9_9EURO|nr:hypothetical protein H2200_005709 [Cladophialophora chaetospira]